MAAPAITSAKVKKKARTVSAVLQVSDTCSDARNRLIDWAAYSAVGSRYGYYYDYYGYGGLGLDDDLGSAEAAPTATRASSSKSAGATAGPSSYTTTNVQERGVDEADIVKTDGKYIYTVFGRDVVIIKSWPVRDLEIVARHTLPKNVTPSQLFLRGDKLVVMGQFWEQLDTDKKVARDDQWYGNYWGARNYFYGTRVTVLDISDRTEPEVVHEADLEGWMSQSRMVGSDLYFVSNAQVHIPPSFMKEAHEYTEGMPEVTTGTGREYKQIQKDREIAFRILRKHLRKKFRNSDLTDAMPRMRHSNANGKMTKLTNMYSCEDVYVPGSGSQLGILNLAHIDLDEPDDVKNIGLFASGWQVYASTDALYVAMPNWGWNYYWGWGQSSYDESKQNTSQIHRFLLRGEDDRPEYTASGTVQGHLLNQFSMSEHRGYLRVATTDQNWWWGGRGRTTEEAPANNLYVLRKRGRRLKVVGQIEGLAPGERIYSARMVGDKGYVVTFRQTDPLFTLDLSNPRKPEVAGELKINGFSSYIHPLGKDHLLTIGQDATDQGRVLGVHLQIFDVSDPAKPKRSFHEKLDINGGYSWSVAQWDHHAFTYDPNTRTLSFPLQIYDYQNMDNSFSGLVMYEIDKKKGFKELGRIAHDDLIEESHDAFCSDSRNAKQQACTDQAHYKRYWYGWYTPMLRSIIMEKYVFSLSSLGLQVNSLYKPSRVHSYVLFADQQLIAR